MNSKSRALAGRHYQETMQWWDNANGSQAAALGENLACYKLHLATAGQPAKGHVKNADQSSKIAFMFRV
jgi:hypothetical protein